MDKITFLTGNMFLGFFMVIPHDLVVEKTLLLILALFYTFAGAFSQGAD
jgi:hypothetical protein